jgi:hypothetical protein
MILTTHCKDEVVHPLLTLGSHLKTPPAWENFRNLFRSDEEEEGLL